MDNLRFIKTVRDHRRLTNQEVAELTEYSLGSVQAWFARPGGKRNRPVPDRAVKILKLKLGLTEKPTIPQEAGPPKTHIVNLPG